MSQFDYSVETTIHLPRERVVELFNNEENLFKWMHDLKSYTHLSGEPGGVGAKAELNIVSGKRDMKMVETITQNSFPDYFEATYEMDKVWNLQGNHFQDAGSGSTRYVVDCTFKISGFFGLIAPFMKGVFVKQSTKYIEQFKAFAESEA